MNSRKKCTGSEVNITSTMIWAKIVIHTYSWSICAHFRVIQYGLLFYFDTDNCLFKKNTLQDLNR
jgi:hypothetical protein